MKSLYNLSDWSILDDLKKEALLYHGEFSVESNGDETYNFIVEEEPPKISNSAIPGIEYRPSMELVKKALRIGDMVQLDDGRHYDVYHLNGDDGRIHLEYHQMELTYNEPEDGEEVWLRDVIEPMDVISYQQNDGDRQLFKKVLDKPDFL